MKKVSIKGMWGVEERAVWDENASLKGMWGGGEGWTGTNNVFHSS